MTEADALSDAELARQAQAGKKHAFDQLVVRHKGALYRFVRRYIGDDDDAYDIVQDTFISAWMALGRYDLERAFPTWLRAIALNKCRDFGRRQAVHRHFLRFFAPQQSAIAAEGGSEASVERDLIETKRLQRLDKAIAALPPFYKAPLLLATVSGLSQQDIAKQLNTTTKAIEMRIRRAKKKLAGSLSDIPKREG